MTKPAALEEPCNPSRPGQSDREFSGREPGARWHAYLALAADLVFETDGQGRFTFIGPDPALGWQAAALLGRSGEDLLLQDSRFGSGLDPFRPLAPIRDGRAWLRRCDGEAVCLSFTAAPRVNDAGRIIGAGGAGVDVTGDERWRLAAASDLRRLDVLDHTLWRLRQEVTAHGMITGALAALTSAIGADGAAVVRAPTLRASTAAADLLRHHAGVFTDAVLQAIPDLVGRLAKGPTTARRDGTEFLVCPCITRFRPPEALALWRGCRASRWGAEDCDLAGSASGILRVVLEHEVIQAELFDQSRNDPLTGLLHRGAFVDELARRIDRLERENLPGTLLMIDVDGLERLNRSAGVEAGDAALSALASLLRRTFRPADLLGRLGGDEFAAWLDGADDFAAAERAEALRADGASRLAEIAMDHAPALTISTGIATRWPGRGEEIDTLLNRVDQVLREVKNSDPGQWRVSRPD